MSAKEVSSSTYFHSSSALVSFYLREAAMRKIDIVHDVLAASLQRNGGIRIQMKRVVRCSEGRHK